MEQFIFEIIKSAGDLLREKYFSYKRPNIVRNGYNPATKLDLKVSDFLIDKITDKFPKHAILSEEKDKLVKPSDDNFDYLWIIDPCDGTTNYISKISFFSVSIAMLRKGEIVVGAVYDPIKKEFFYSEKGSGAQLNGRLLKICNKTELSNASLHIDICKSWGSLEEEIEILKIIGPEVGVVRSLHACALELCYIAANRIDIKIDNWCKPWDIMAGVLILREAGGLTTDLFNNEIDIGSKTLLAANKYLHKKTFELITCQPNK